MTDIVERLNDSLSAGYSELRKEAAVEIMRLRAKITEMEKQEPVAWRTFDGEGGYDYRSYEDNENYKLGWDARNPNHIGWVEPLYALPGAQTAPSVPECPYPCGWRNLLKYAIEDGAYLARSINEDDPVTENARAVTMRMVMRLRDVLMAVNNAAPEAKP